MPSHIEGSQDICYINIFFPSKKNNLSDSIAQMIFLISPTVTCGAENIVDTGPLLANRVQKSIKYSCFNIFVEGRNNEREKN